MQCVICKQGTTRSGAATVTLERNGTTVVFRNVPAQVCQTCGEEYVNEETTQRLLADAERAVNAGVQIEVRAFAAV